MHPKLVELISGRISSELEDVYLVDLADGVLPPVAQFDDCLPLRPSVWLNLDGK
jgi:hypothetical protein